MGLGLKMNRQMKNKILQLFTKNQAKDKESSFDLEENWPGNGAKNTLNPHPFTSLSSALSRGRGTHLQTHHLTHLRVVFLRNQAPFLDLTSAKINSGSVGMVTFFSFKSVGCYHFTCKKKHQET